jgi:NAD(P)-dependent dehydrogenase (short-subunit alcohol dehydrogenase family)
MTNEVPTHGDRRLQRGVEEAPVAVVTGANSGLGRATTIHLARHGFTVYGTVRDTTRAATLMATVSDEQLDVTLVEMDVADDDSVRAGFAHVLDRARHVDALVNNAGVAPSGVTEETSTATFADAFNVNVCGAIRCTQAVLPGMRDRRHGTIVNISSIVGKVALIGQAAYASSKFALEGLSDALAQEVAGFGVRVAVIEPGITRSAIFAKSVDPANESGAYDAHYARMRAFYSTGLANATDPFEVASVVLHAITTDEPALRYVVSWGSGIVERRRDMSDEAWLSLGAHIDDASYFNEFERQLGIRLTQDPV